jgi:hypothetical protein
VWNDDLTRPFWVWKEDAIDRGGPRFLSGRRLGKRNLTENNKDIYEQSCKDLRRQPGPPVKEATDKWLPFRKYVYLKKGESRRVKSVTLKL